MQPHDDGGKLRLFIAVGLPQKLHDSLIDLQKKLKPFARDAKWVNPNGIHLTLKFLGYVDPVVVPDIEGTLLKLSKDFGPVKVLVRGVGYFPNSRRPNVLWCGVTAPELHPLQQEIEEQLARSGFEKENRAFNPHLTLARFRDPHGLIPLTRETDRMNDLKIGEFTAKEFSIYRSILRRQGAEYSVIKTFALGHS